MADRGDVRGPKTFRMLNVSSKFAICGLPVRVDTYRSCSFGCEYCFANSRKIMEFDKGLRIGSLVGMEREYARAMSGGSSLLDVLIRRGVTWHCGGMSDPFQPCESEYHITRGLCDFTRERGVTVLFSTKADDLRGCESHLDPRIHSFQMSVSNVDDRTDLEPNVPPIESRKKLFDSLKERGFKVGIRIQPFIPGITMPDIVDMFSDADHFTIEGLKLVPQNREHVQRVLEATGLTKDLFTQMGLLNLKPEIRLDAYRDVVERINYYGKPYSIADNDMHHIGCSRCCCGDSLVHKSSGFDSTVMSMEHGREWTIDDVRDAAGEDVWVSKASQLFTSNRTEGCSTVGDFYEKRFGRKSSPFSPKYLVDDCCISEMDSDEDVRKESEMKRW